MNVAVLASSVSGLELLLAAIFTGSCAIIGPLLLRRAQSREKRIDREREDMVATEALRQQEEVAQTAKQAAKLLFDAQAETKQSAKEAAEGTREVARLVAEGDFEHSKQAVQEATPIVLFYPNGQREEVVLSGVPRVGDHVRIRNGRGTTPDLIVDAVLWMEAFLPPPNPSVVVIVHSDQKMQM